MDAKGLRSLLLLLVLSWMVAEMEAERTFESFKHDNVDYPAPPVSDAEYCTAIMNERGLNYKKGNVFIHASDADLIGVCTLPNGRRLTFPRMYSFIIFRLTVCKALGEASDGMYDKYRASEENEPVILRCEDGMPVQFRTYGRLVGLEIIFPLRLGDKKLSKAATELYSLLPKSKPTPFGGSHTLHVL